MVQAVRGAAIDSSDTHGHQEEQVLVRALIYIRATKEIPWLSLNTQLIKELRRLKAEELKREKMEEAARLRKESVHKANLIRRYKPTNIMRSDKPLTDPHSPSTDDLPSTCYRPQITNWQQTRGCVTFHRRRSRTADLCCRTMSLKRVCAGDCCRLA
jgi:hypothetical protein